MQKTMITAATVFALLMSAGASMAGPLNGHSFGGKTHDARSTVSQALDNADRGANTHQTTTVTGSNPISELPNVVVVPVQGDGSYTLIIGKSSSPDLLGAEENKHVPVFYE
ncbi:hypothetical protein [Ruegeria atlantica]|uniref:hypothetical protein n=1 Tax=Ruegeria atlantica TaxID=81569 RepID=UPI0014808B87|nr:hypothetical protein [Ruegeria atlantica]